MAEPPKDTASVLGIVHGAFVARALYTVTVLGVPDLLADGARTCPWLAERLAVAPVPLHQLMRALASTGLFRTENPAEPGPCQRFALTADGATLRTGDPSGHRELVLFMQGPVVAPSLAALPERVRTGRSGPEVVDGVPFFAYLQRDPALAAQFGRVMTATHGDEPAAVAAAYDLSWARRLVDVGGGTGAVAAAFLERHPDLRAVVFDLPEAAPNARAALAGRGLATRCDVVTGDFLDHVPTGGDAYLLSRILHDWDDAVCARILRSAAAAMSPHSRLLVVEKVLPDGDGPHLGKTLDLIMATLTTGRERGLAEYRALLAAAGLRVTRTVPSDSASTVIEAVPG